MGSIPTALTNKNNSLTEIITKLHDERGREGQRSGQQTIALEIRVAGLMKAQRIDTVRKFFEAVVEVDAAEFNAEQTDLRLAYHSCISLLSLRAWIAETHKYKPWTFCRETKRPFSNDCDLAKELNLINKCFSIVADIANTTKHMIRREGRRTATTSIIETTSVRNGSILGMAEFNGAMLNDPSGEFIEEWIATEIEGVSYDVVHCVNSTLALWRTLIAENSWLD